MRDVIVLSAWKKSANGTPERLAHALTLSGANVLYAEQPEPFTNGLMGKSIEVASKLFWIRPFIVGHKLFRMRVLNRLQARLVAIQIQRQAKNLGLQHPVCFFVHSDETLLIASALKNSGMTMVHLSIDDELPQCWPHIEMADLVLVLQESVFHLVHQRYPRKTFYISQIFSQHYELSDFGSAPAGFSLSSLPKRYLLYLGALQQRIDRELVRALLVAHPELQLISFGPGRLDLPNHQVFPWMKAEQLNAFLKPGAIGFMPYRLDDAKNLNCVPLKLFDFFAEGLPIVTTPIHYVNDKLDLLYIGATVDQMLAALQQAMDEPLDSPKRVQRRNFALRHSEQHVARYLAPLLDESSSFPPDSFVGLAEPLR